MNSVYKKPIYPEIEIKRAALNNRFHEGSTNHVRLMSYVRKKHRGKWYLILIMDRYERNSREMDYDFRETTRMMNKFHNTAYRTLISFKIDLKHKPPLGEKPYFELDPNQQDESERLLYI